MPKQTKVPLSKAEWIKRYGGQAALDREGMRVVPCVDCDDSICHGWRVEKTGLAISLMGNPRNLADFTDAELAAMVRNGAYAQGTRFGDGPNECRFLLVLAVPYGKGEAINSLWQALEAFHRLVSDDDWPERNFQVYDHRGKRFFEIRREDLP